MADGTFAALLLLLGVMDMDANHCDTEAGCFGLSYESKRLSFAGGEVIPRQAPPATEYFLRYDLGVKTGPFGHTIGISYCSGGEFWAGIGPTLRHEAESFPLYAELHLMAGFYQHNGGFDLGGPIEFRSGIEIGYELKDGWRIGLSYDHRSNGDMFPANPGIETAMLRLSVPLD